MVEGLIYLFIYFEIAVSHINHDTSLPEEDTHTHTYIYMCVCVCVYVCVCERERERVREREREHFNDKREKKYTHRRVDWVIVLYLVFSIYCSTY